MKKHILSAMLVAVSLTGLPCAIAQNVKNAAAPTVGHAAPDFTRKTLDGKPARLSAYRGKVVLLNFWATWCGPCMAEMPKFSSWQTKYGSQGFQVLGVSMDDEQAPVEKVNHKLQLSYPIMMGDEHLGTQFGGVLGLPISFLIGRDGKVIERFQGQTNLDQMEKKIVAALQAK